MPILNYSYQLQLYWLYQLQFAPVFGSAFSVVEKPLCYIHCFVLYRSPFFTPSSVSRKNNTLPIVRRYRLKSIYSDLRFVCTPITIMILIRCFSRHCVRKMQVLFLVKLFQRCMKSRMRGHVNKMYIVCHECTICNYD